MTRVLVSLWRDAVPLSVAHIEFAPPDLLRRYERLRTLKEPLLGGPGLWARQLEEEFRKNPNIFNKFYQSFVKWSNAKRENLYSIRKIIIEDIEEGYIEAVGYLVGGVVNAPPVEVPIRFFSNSIINWQADCISAPPFEFRQVRLVEVPKTDSSLYPVKKIGRPSVAEAIRAAVLALDRSDPNFRNLGRKVQCEPIIKFMQNIGGDEKSPKTPSERTIKKLIPAILN